MTYPIAEIFTSVQGEGDWTGTRMCFVRLAGCTVGKPYAKTEDRTGLELYQEKCTLWDGREFPCDTNYKKTATMSPAQILQEVNDEVRVCLTGGEPLMHDVTSLIRAFVSAGKIIHLETSGTIDLKEIREKVDWIAVSPKKGAKEAALKSADEVKVLVDEHFDVERFEREILSNVPQHKIWFQPVNGLNTINDNNLSRCKDLQAVYKYARISVQMHKWMGVR